MDESPGPVTETALSELTDDDVRQRMVGIPWFQRWEIRPGLFTPGVNPIAELLDRCEVPGDLAGRRVLDIGASDGCASFECERRGAAEVVALSTQDPCASGFDTLKCLLDSKVEYRRRSVYELDPRELGRFDAVLFFGVLYHLRYPLLAVDRIRAVAAGDVYIETHLVSNRRILRGRGLLATIVNLNGWFRRTPLWRQYRPGELRADDPTNWFGPNVAAVLEGFETAGFRTRHLDTWKSGSRGAFKAVVAGKRPTGLGLPKLAARGA